MTTNNSFHGPLFVFGMARSGTTYLRRALNSFPDVFLMYECTTIRLAYDIFQKQDVLKDRDTFQRYLEYLKDHEKHTGGKPSAMFMQPLEFYDHLYQSFFGHRDFSEFCRELFSVTVTQGGIWGNKLVIPEELQMLRGIFKDSRFIIVIRDVRSVAYSNYDFFGGNYFTTALIWTDIARLIQSFRQNNAESRAMIIRYEDLVRDPKKTLREIAFFIGREIPDDFFTSNKAHTKSIAKWRKHLTSPQIRQIEEISINEMKQFGYIPDVADAPRKMNKFRFILSFILNIRGRLMKRKSSWIDLISHNPLLRYLRIYKKN